MYIYIYNIYICMYIYIYIYMYVYICVCVSVCVLFLGISGTVFYCIPFPFHEEHGPNLATIPPACNRKCRASRSSLCLMVHSPL